MKRTGISSFNIHPNILISLIYFFTNILFHYDDSYKGSIYIYMIYSDAIEDIIYPIKSADIKKIFGNFLSMIGSRQRRPILLKSGRIISRREKKIY